MGRAVLPTVREKSSPLPGERAAHRTNPAARVQSTHGTQQAETKVDTRHLSLGRTTLRDLCSQTHESHKQRPVAAQSAAQPTLCRRPCARTRARDWEKTRGLPWRLPGNTHAGRGRFKFAVYCRSLVLRAGPGAHHASSADRCAVTSAWRCKPRRPASASRWRDCCNLGAEPDGAERHLRPT